MGPMRVAAVVHVGVTAWRARTCDSNVRARYVLIAALLAALLLGGGDGATDGGFAPAATLALVAAHHALDVLGWLGGAASSRVAKFGQLLVSSAALYGLLSICLATHSGGTSDFAPYVARHAAAQREQICGAMDIEAEAVGRLARRAARRASVSATVPPLPPPQQQLLVTAAALSELARAWRERPPLSVPGQSLALLASLGLEVEAAGVSARASAALALEPAAGSAPEPAGARAPGSSPFASVLSPVTDARILIDDALAAFAASAGRPVRGAAEAEAVVAEWLGLPAEPATPLPQPWARELGGALAFSRESEDALAALGRIVRSTRGGAAEAVAVGLGEEDAPAQTVSALVTKSLSGWQLSDEESDESVLDELLALLNAASDANPDSDDRDGGGDRDGAPARGADGGRRASGARGARALSRESLSASAEATMLSAIEAWRLDRDDSHDGAVVVALRRLRAALRLGCGAFSAAAAEPLGPEEDEEQEPAARAERADGAPGGARPLAAAVAGAPLEAHALTFLRLFELQPDVGDATVVAEMLSMLELGDAQGAAHALPPPIGARLLAAVAAHRGAVGRALGADALIRGGLRALGPLLRDRGATAALPAAAAAVMRRFVRKLLALSAHRLPADASAAQVARELLAVVGLRPALAHAPRGGVEGGAAALLLRATEAELARLRAAGATGRVWWTAHASKLPFGGLAPLRASALLRACAPAALDGGGEGRGRGGGASGAPTVASAAAVARCDANDFALALAAVLHAAGARVRLRASCERAARAEPAGTVCSLAAEVPAPPTAAPAARGDGGGGGGGCAAGDCEWVLVPAACLPAGARAAGDTVALAARRAAPASLAGGRGGLGDVWLALEWGAQTLARAIVADEGETPLVWLVDGQRAEPADDEPADDDDAAAAPAAAAARTQLDVTFCASDDPRADGGAECVGPLGAVAAAAAGGAEAGQPAYERVWLVCEGCAPPAGAAAAPSDACVCRVESADLARASRPAGDADGAPVDARTDADDVTP